MAFAICFTDEPEGHLADNPSTPFAFGQIRAGELCEGFASSLHEWTRSDYEAQWLGSLEQLIAGAERVGLITEYVKPAKSTHLRWWALYRDQGGIVHLQEHLLFYDQIGSAFSVAKANEFLKARTTESEDGRRISEWDVSVGEIKRFVDEVKRQRT